MRVLLALAGKLEPGDLTAAELLLYDDALLGRFITPDAEEAAAMTAPGQSPDAVGLDEHGQLVERSDDGQLHPYKSKG